MQITLETIISAACSNAEKLESANKTQQIFRVDNASEAKLVFDLLIAYGFDTKFYPENNAAKLYIANPKPSQLSNKEMMAEIYAYARSFTGLKTQAEQLASDINNADPMYRLSFSNTPSSGKQITVHITSPNQPAKSPSTSNTAPPAAPRASKPTTKPVTKKQEEEIFLGPEIMRPAGRRKSNAINTEGPDSLWKRCKLYVKGNSIIAALVIITTIALTVVLLSLFVLSKAFLCPDFASMKEKSPPWYCSL